MKKLFLLMLSLLVFNAAAQELNYLENEVLVQLKQNVNASDLSNEIGSVQIETMELVSRPLNIWRLQLEPSPLTVAEAIREFYGSANVLIAQKNHKVTLRATPNDALYGNQWQYFQSNDRDIDADEAWDVATGGTTLNGDVIVAAVLDDGVDIDHEDLGDNLWTNEAEIPNNNIDDDNNNYVDDYLGWSIVTNSDNVSGGSHGTPVAGIVGAQGDNGIGVSGVNWDVKVMVIKNNFNTNEAQVIEAYSYALEARMLYNASGGTEGAFVVSTNASWGVDFGDPADAPLWCDLYDTLGENGILSCGATINGNFDVDVIGDLPTACPSEYLIAVTNTDITDNKVTNAGFGAETIDLGAPGSGAYNTANNNGYGPFGGTSGATPHVTGTIALLYSAPCQNLADLAISNPSEAAKLVRDFIFAGVDPNPSLEGITTTGGRLNMNNAIQGLMANCETLSVNGFDAIEGSIKLFPNPSSGIVTISHPQNSSLAEVMVYALDGRLVKKFDNVQSNNVDLTALTAGMYVLRTKFENDSNVYSSFLVRD